MLLKYYHIVTVATINFSLAGVWLLIEGGFNELSVHAPEGYSSCSVCTCTCLSITKLAATYLHVVCESKVRCYHDLYEFH